MTQYFTNLHSILNDYFLGEKAATAAAAAVDEEAFYREFQARLAADKAQIVAAAEAQEKQRKLESGLGVMQGENDHTERFVAQVIERKKRKEEKWLI
jgi:hypothetical protein